jgi:hypothetical protein
VVEATGEVGLRGRLVQGVCESAGEVALGGQFVRGMNSGSMWKPGVSG